MDIGLPNISGIEGVKMVKENFNTIEVMMFTVFEDDDKIFEALAAGASGISSEKIFTGRNYRSHPVVVLWRLTYECRHCKKSNFIFSKQSSKSENSRFLSPQEKMKFYIPW